jgi:hypothetical protein
MLEQISEPEFDLPDTQRWWPEVPQNSADSEYPDGGRIYEPEFDLTDTQRWWLELS